MPMQVLLNLLIGFMWMFFQDHWSMLTFLSGYCFGLFVLFLLRRFFSTKFYPITLFYVVNLIIVFMYELFASSVLVIKQILRPKLNISPGIFTLETDLETDLEITLLAMLITLTPGSVVTEISHDGKRFYIHAMDIPESSNAVLRSQKKFEAAIKKVTRP